MLSGSLLEAPMPRKMGSNEHRMTKAWRTLFGF
jgi:hypothetical protein